MTNEKKAGRLYRCMTAIFLLIIAFSIAQPVSAASKNANNMPVRTEICIRHEVNGNASLAGEDTYILSANDKSIPMPEGSENGEKVITTGSTGESSFGTMIIRNPDVYEYTVTRVKNDRKNVMKSYDKYNVRIVALNNGKVSKIITIAGGSEKSELLFEDTVISGSPETGDRFHPEAYGMLCAGSAAIILFMLGRTGRRNHTCITGK